jgi:prevent-host-death family protein
MSDHKSGGRQARQTVGVRELKAHAARILRHVRETHASYIVTHRGRSIGVLLPIEAGDGSHDAHAEAPWSAFLEAGRRLERRFRPGASGVKILSEMRR